MRPFGGAKLAALATIAATGLAFGAAVAGAGVRTHGYGPPTSTTMVQSPGGGSGGGYNPSRCKQPSHADKWYCQPSTTTTSKPHVVIPPTTTTTQPSTTTTTAGTAPPSGGTAGTPSPPAPAVASGGNSGGSLVALPQQPTLPVADAPRFEPPAEPLPGFDGLLGRDSGGVPLSMAIVIALAGLATVVLVLRGTFGRGAHAASASGEGESLKFH